MGGLIKPSIINFLQTISEKSSANFVIKMVLKTIYKCLFFFFCFFCFFVVKAPPISNIKVNWDAALSKKEGCIGTVWGLLLVQVIFWEQNA
jgi:hypothetical protein